MVLCKRFASFCNQGIRNAYTSAHLRGCVQVLRPQDRLTSAARSQQELAPLFESEAVTELSLLTSMGALMLRENLVDIGVSEQHVQRRAMPLHARVTGCGGGRGG
eukprot:4037340-Pleurochrysis_carterae.AAC.2